MPSGCSRAKRRWRTRPRLEAASATRTRSGPCRTTGSSRPRRSIRTPTAARSRRIRRTPDTNLQAQQQQYAQGQGAYTTNAQTQLAQQQQGFSQALQGYQTNFQDPLAAYQAQVGANLGYGNLGVAQQGANTASGYLGLAANNQAFQQPYQLAQLGLEGTQGATQANLGYTGQLTGLYGANASAQGNYITGGGNAIAASQVGSGNAYAGAANNVGQYAGLAAYLAQHQPPQNSGTNNPYAIHN